MTINFNQGLIGLSLLSGSNMAGLGLSPFKVEPRAVRVARAQFTLPEVTPPWREKPSSTPLPAQVAAIRRMSSIIDQVRLSGPTLPPDVQTAFTTYRALDRLRMLAETAMRSTTGSAERSQLQLTFAKGMADLQKYLAAAPSDKLTLAFGQPTRRAESVQLDPAPPAQTPGARLVAQRTDALPGLTGSETFSLTLSRGTASDTVTVDLSTTPQPPTIDSIVEAFNTAIIGVPQRDTLGNVVLDGSGNPVPKYTARFEAVKLADGWGLQLDSLIDRVAIDQVGAGDALMVAAGQTALDAPTTTGLFRFDDPAGAIERRTLGSFAATDRQQTALDRFADSDAPAAVATTATRAIATDAQGFSYVVGTTAGDLGANRGDGQDDLFLTKLDNDGRILWQRALGTAGSADGAAISIAGNGDIVVAGTVTGGFDGATTDGDMMVARFSAAGEERFATVVRSLGADSARAVAVAGDGTIYVGGRAASGTGDAFLARLDASGRLQERRTIDSGSTDMVRALQVDSDGSLVALTSEAGRAVVRRIGAGALATDLGQIDLGIADARALAIDASGAIAVAGATSAALTGAQVNGLSGGRDGFVTRIDAGLASAETSYVGSSGDDQIDSVTFMGGALYAGGRTTGAIGGPRVGAVDGFVARLDSATGALATTSQWGRTGMRIEPVQVAAARGGGNVIGALGFTRGTINAENSQRLTAQTTLRAGDEFSFRVNDGTVRRVTIGATDTLATLAERVGRLAGANITVTSSRVGERSVLRIQAKPGQMIELIAGPAGKDALGKLGFAPSRLVAPPTPDSKAPAVRPGGNFGLELDPALNIGTAAAAKTAFDRIERAVSTAQSGFRSLYWDDLKETLVMNNGRTGRVSPYLAAQVGRYQDALARLGGGGGGGGFSLFGV